MIKNVIAIIFAFIVILAICVASSWYINSTANKIANTLTPIETSINKEDWDKAKQTFADAKKQWDKYRSVWKVLIHHDDLKDIEIGFTEVEELIEQKDVNETKKELTTLIFYLRHVPENENLDYSNLF